MPPSSVQVEKGAKEASSHAITASNFKPPFAIIPTGQGHPCLRAAGKALYYLSATGF